MNYFDLHCDTVYEALKQKCSLKNNRLHLAADRANGLENWVQTFAFWIPDAFRGEDAYNCFEKQFDYFMEQYQNSNCFSLFEKEEKRHCQALLAVEGGAVLGGDLNHIWDLQNKGVSILTLCWNGANEIGAGADAFGGLTSFGHDVITELEKADIIVDVSHLNEETFWDVAGVAQRPFIATHSNAMHVCQHQRNLKDEQIRAILDCKGLIGLNFYTQFLSQDGVLGVESLKRHIEHFLQLGCENILAIGSDFDGAQMPKDIKGIESIPLLYEQLVKSFGRNQIDKIFYQNAYHFFSNRR